jgi:hypothetical protein
MEHIADDKKIRVLDILSHIEKLNKLIDLHTSETQSRLMIQQYDSLRQQFIAELKVILSDFQLTVDVAKAA